MTSFAPDFGEQAFDASAMRLLGFDPALPLLDLRAASAYAQGHCPGACHWPASERVPRRHELPPPGSTLQLLHDDALALQQTQQDLQQWGYVIALARVVESTEWPPSNCLVSGGASRPLWQPSATLQRAVSQFSPTDGRALDLACGSGRDALYLAMGGFSVLAIDNNADALQRLQGSAAAWQLRIDTACMDLEAGAIALPEQHFALISVVRYLHRPLLPRLRDWLAPGGLLVYETFVLGAEQFGSPRNPAYLLAPGELASVFTDWSILHDQVVPLADGRPVQQFVARRPVAV